MNSPIQYIRSFGPETKFVPIVVADLEGDLAKTEIPQADAMEIVLAVDEALTNAILETARTKGANHEQDKDSSQLENSVTVSWAIDSDRFSFTVIDQGEGLDLDIMIGNAPVPGESDYFEKVQEYEQKDQLVLRINGKPVEVKRFGAGLKIILSFMDKITIDYIDKEAIVTKQLSGATQGTIMTMIRYLDAEQRHNQEKTIE
jgi:anti-sigma regulatory factor (Ser/Thr protein kinase)